MKARSSALLFVLGIVALTVICGGEEVGEEWGEVQHKTYYPDWSHDHWVWLSSFWANQTNETQLVSDYLKHNISVGCVDIDSDWSTGTNNFIWDNKKYPNPKAMIDYFHSVNVRVILWVTSMVNNDSSNYQEGLHKGYYVQGLDGNLIKWWHGHGSLLDYTNPDAVQWWHSQLDGPLSLGIDGWKTDGTDPFIFALIVAWGKAGVISEREYANLYYSDFYDYTRTKNPSALIMSRPVDSYPPIYLDFSPRNVCFAGWVGDQDPSFSGLRDALTNMFHSAWAKYVNFGSDIGGYRCCGPKPFGRTTETFIRWFQLGAFNSLMENGGDGEHRPWMFDTPGSTFVVDLYRQFVGFHYELKPYLYGAGNTAFETGVSVMKPIADFTIFQPDSWDFWLWRDLFVAPIVENGTRFREITFPQNHDYVDWWDYKLVYYGGQRINYSAPLNRLPVFHRKGSMLPLNVEHDLGVGHGDESSRNKLTLLINYLSEEGADTQVREWEGMGQRFRYSYNEEKKQFILKASVHKREVIVLIRGVVGDQETIKVVDGQKELVRDQDWQLNGDQLKITPKSKAGQELLVVVSGIVSSK